MRIYHAGNRLAGIKPVIEALCNGLDFCISPVNEVFHAIARLDLIAARTHKEGGDHHFMTKSKHFS